ncbi:hypothetical protein OIV83_002022 [Microbotryomycetes sp. JL201]|nr:hypothetical protein OIV83_002022 [Microbotryomycetes sp. JL201]
MTPPAQLYALPIPQRPKHGNLALGIVWAVLFNVCIVLTHVTQLILIVAPRRILHKVTKSIFGVILVAMTQIFAPTKLVVTVGHGVDEQTALERDGRGNVTGIKLGTHSVWMSNHQTLCDWVYIWSFAYFAHLHQSIFIILKASIGKVPIVGWGAKLYGFIFLDRSWEKDRIVFAKQLQHISAGVNRDSANETMTLLIFPEGTIVTNNTRPKSLAFAEKTGISDFDFTLLPRSTGLFFSLRNLVKTVPDLTLVDLTIGYPGACNAPQSYPEDHYSLSIWFKQTPPPAVHVHIRQYNVLKEVPLGDLSNVEVGDGSLEERQAFDKWLRDRWQEKDDLMKVFVKQDRFDRTSDSDDKQRQAIEWNVKLRHSWEFAEVFSWFGPLVLFGLVWWAWTWWSGPKLQAAMLLRPADVQNVVERPCCAKAVAATAMSYTSSAISTAASRLEL